MKLTSLGLFTLVPFGLFPAPTVGVENPRIALPHLNEVRRIFDEVEQEVGVGLRHVRDFCPNEWGSALIDRVHDISETLKEKANVPHLVREISTAGCRGDAECETKFDLKTLAERAKHIVEDHPPSRLVENDLKHVLDKVGQEVGVGLRHIGHLILKELSQELGTDLFDRVQVITEMLKEKGIVPYVVQVVSTAGCRGDPECEGKLDFKTLAERAKHIMEDHPEAVITVGVVFIVGTSIYFFGPEVAMQVLRELGFGPLGPVKGSLAALVQSALYKGNVPAGSPFSWLQRLGMTDIVSTVRKLL